ncbi:HupE/UreJ family protein [Sabulilitoribacter arenilitoris]|uniref:HupE/UreJ family protein n=1 Tax=Wocania arenilitoris TaxID=2044858 RepID=A0AAE3EQ65_9FLAO|nr:HupE/UreJ family protein [Wocania arenilitoris]MCF7568035.1 HupE/UreJ family protein [Wocania arenilitoris]
MNKYILRTLLLIFLLSPICKTFAHHPDNSLLYLKVYENANIEGDFHINVNELNDVLGLNLSKRTSIDEVTPHLSKIKKYLLENTSFSSLGKTYNIVFTDKIKFLQVGYGDFVLVNFYLENTQETPDKLDVTYKVFIEEEPNHMNLLGMEYNWKAGLFNNESIIALDFSNNNWTKTLDLTEGSVWTGFKAMIRQGVWHIWIGLDHILFIIALILPAVVRRKKTDNTSFSIWSWVPVKKFKPAFLYIIKIITFFTIAHTITLSLASLQIIVLPSQLVESVIALSIGLAAYHNIKPIFKGKDWIIAFVFGLFHGFGFASVLGDLGFNGEHLTLSLLGFNIGVEIGQVAIIAAIFPVLYLIRKLKLYPKFLVYMSVLLIIISLYWLIERAFDIDLPVDDYIRRRGYEFAVWLGLR